MSFEFLDPGAAVAEGAFTPVARSPMERDAIAAGARFEIRDGWKVAVRCGTSEREANARLQTVGWADTSHLGKLEIQAGADALAAIVAQSSRGAVLEPGLATRAAEAWWCPVTSERALVICEPAALDELRERALEAAGASDGPVSVIEVSTVHAALTVVGPGARELFARFTAVDLRPHATPVRGFRPASLARTPGMLLREDDDRFLILFGWALGHYMWTVVADAGERLGGSPIGVDALVALEPQVQEASPRA